MGAPMTPAADGNKGVKTQWLAPAVIVAVVVALVLGGKKKSEVVENPLVDFAILTVGVFAFAAMFRFIATKLGSNGLAQFFGSPAGSSSTAK